MRITSLACALFLCPTPSFVAQAPVRRPIAVDDMYRMQQVGNPRCSPDGAWIVYTVTAIDREADARHTSIWMVNWEGTQNLRLTNGPSSESSPRWSPDGKFLAFLSARPADANTQLWLLDRHGGEARQLTDVKGDIGDFEWSPNGKLIVLEMSSGDDNDTEAAKLAGKSAKAPKPIVIDSYHFKHDNDGYLAETSRSQLYLFDLENRKLEPLTTDRRYDDSDPTWSPDGTRIAFVSNHEKEPDRTGTNDIFIIDAHPGAAPRKLVTAFSASGQRLMFSPDGALLGYLEGSETKYNAYSQNRLVVVPVVGGTPRMLAGNLDRGVSSPDFTPDGTSVVFLVRDDRRAYVARVAVSGGEVQRLSGQELVVYQLASARGHTAVVAAADTVAPEIYALEAGKLRKLTSHNDALLSELQLGAVEDITFNSEDGTEVHGMMIKPPAYDSSRQYPTLLWIHGGPNMQDDHGLQFNTYPLQLERQIFAAQGYVVLAINYRGSAGRGAKYTRSIFADWGHKEAADLLAGVDYAVARGIADPDRLGIGGWSYGGILTDYVIASDTRFKAAISGAGIGNEISMYGSDQYVLQYDNEIGPPWKSLDTWLKISYPFFHANRIRTPTLFMGGQSDFNVPIAGSEQMYQALRTLGIPTQLVIYPGQNHLFSRPSYIHDRMLRFIAWFDRYLKPQK